MSIPQVFEQNMSLVRYFRFCCCGGRLIYQSGSQIQSTPHCKFPPVWLTNFCHHKFSSGWVLCLPDKFSQWGGINCQLADNNFLHKKISWPLSRFSKFFFHILMQVFEQSLSLFSVAHRPGSSSSW